MIKIDINGDVATFETIEEASNYLCSLYGAIAAKKANRWKVSAGAGFFRSLSEEEVLSLSEEEADTRLNQLMFPFGRRCHKCGSASVKFIQEGTMVRSLPQHMGYLQCESHKCQSHSRYPWQAVFGTMADKWYLIALHTKWLGVEQEVAE